MVNIHLAFQVGSLKLLKHSSRNHCRSMFVGRNHDYDSFGQADVSERRKNRILVPEDAGLHDVDTALTNVAVLAGKSVRPRRNFNRDYRHRALAPALEL